MDQTRVFKCASNKDWNIPFRRLSLISRYEMKQRSLGRSNKGKRTVDKFQRDFLDPKTKKIINTRACEERIAIMVDEYHVRREKRKTFATEPLSDVDISSDIEAEYSEDEGIITPYTKNFDFGCEIMEDIRTILNQHLSNNVNVNWQLISTYIKILCFIHGKRHLLAPSDGGEYINKSRSKSAAVAKNKSEIVRFGQSHVRRLVQRLRLPSKFACSSSEHNANNGVFFDAKLLSELFPNATQNYARENQITLEDAINRMKTHSKSDNSTILVDHSSSSGTSSACDDSHSSGSSNCSVEDSVITVAKRTKRINVADKVASGPLSALLLAIAEGESGCVSSGCPKRRLYNRNDEQRKSYDFSVVC